MGTRGLWLWRSPWIVALCLGLALIGPGLAGVAGAGEKVTLAADADEEAAVKAVSGSYVDADRKQDVDGILLLFAPDARMDSILFDYGLDTARWAHRSYKLKWTLTKREGRWIVLGTEHLKK